MSHHILVVDDSATIRKAVDITFAHEDFELTTVADGASALAALSEKTPDLALVDANLGADSGLSLAQDMLAAAAGGRFPLVLLSSGQAPVEQSALEAAGFTSQLAKPFHTQELIDHVKTQLGLEVVKSVAAMRFTPRSAKPAAQPTIEPAIVTAPAPIVESTPTIEPAPIIEPPQPVAPPPALIKGPPPPTIKGPPPPAPNSSARIQLQSTPTPFETPAPEPALITPPPAAEAPAPALIPEAPVDFDAPSAALITEPPLSEPLAAALIPDAPAEPEPPAPVLITEPTAAADLARTQLDDESPFIAETTSPTVMDLPPPASDFATEAAELTPPALDVPELAPIPVPEAPTMVMHALTNEAEDEPYKPEPTHSVPALTSPVTDLGLGIDLGSIAEGVSAGAGKLSVADGEVDMDALMPVIEAAVRKVTAEVVERVVWEVVPDLAERLIREHLNNRGS